METSTRFGDGMSKKRVIVTGASGLLGANLLMEWREKYTVTGIYNRHPISIPGTDSVPADILDPLETMRTIVKLKPDVVVHCAAETRVDYCETHQRQAWKINVQGTEHVAIACAEAGARLVYISTDSVFDGKKGDYTETDATNPLNVYARTKLAGELAARQYGEALIVRTNIFGWSPEGHRPSMAEWMLTQLNSGSIIQAWNDVWFTPILVNHLAGILEQMMGRLLSGIYHVGGRWAITKKDFADWLAAEYLFLGAKSVQPVLVKNRALIAERPLVTSLVCKKTESELGVLMPMFQDGLHYFRSLETNGYLTELRGGQTCRESA